MCKMYKNIININNLRVAKTIASCQEIEMSITICDQWILIIITLTLRLLRWAQRNSKDLINLLLTTFIIGNGVCLEVFVHSPVEVLFQTIAEEVEQALQPVPKYKRTTYISQLSQLCS